MRYKKEMSKPCEVDTDFDFDESMVSFKRAMTERLKKEHLTNTAAIRFDSVVKLGTWTVVVLIVGIVYAVANSIFG